MTPAELLELAISRYRSGDAAGTLALCEQLIAYAPERPEFWQLSGLAEFARENYSQAADRFRRAQRLDPADAAHPVNLANALIRLDRDAEAAEVFAEALRIRPELAEAEIGLGTIARRAGRLEAAVAHADRAIALSPGSYQAAVNRGRALHELGRFAEAIAAYDSAIAIDPGAAPAHAQKALSLLLTGDFAAGWDEYEWRGEGRDLAARARYAAPEWDGAPLAGGTLLVHAEQGFGDTIQFARFLPLAEAQGCRVVVEVPPALKRLFAGFSASVAVVARGEPLPPFDRQVRLMSLPRLLGARLGTIPAPTSFPIPAQSVAASMLLADPRLTVGLAWAGNPAHENDRNRSLSAALLAPLGQLQGIRFVSLQKGAREVPGFVERDLGPTLHDFADLAAAMARLDLLIAVDSAPAHLMASLGRPTWILLPEPPDWRWLLERPDTPWYPAATLFRQGGPGGPDGWPWVVARVCDELARRRDEKGVAEGARSD